MNQKSTTEGKFNIRPLKNNLTEKIKFSKVVALSLFEDPLSVYVFKNIKQRMNLLPLFYELFIEFSLKQGFVDVLLDSEGEIIGGAAWMGPENPIPSPAKMIFRMFSFHYIPLVLKLGLPGLLRLNNFADEVERIHNDFPKPHYYLSILVILPQYIGHGFGKMLLAPVAKKAAEDSIPLYLESSNPLNMSFYLRNGLVIHHKVTPKFGPVSTVLRDNISLRSI